MRQCARFALCAEHAGVGFLSFPSRLVFSEANWDLSQDVLVGAFDDDVTEPPVHRAVLKVQTTSRGDAVYGAEGGVQVTMDARPLLHRELPLEIVDNDAAGLVIEALGRVRAGRAGAAGLVREGGGSGRPARLLVRLASRPLAGVVVVLREVGLGFLALDRGVLTFDPSSTRSSGSPCSRRATRARGPPGRASAASTFRRAPRTQRTEGCGATSQCKCTTPTSRGSRS